LAERASDHGPQRANALLDTLTSQTRYLVPNASSSAAKETAEQIKEASLHGGSPCKERVHSGISGGSLQREDPIRPRTGVIASFWRTRDVRALVG
jgi:hypothetical protein